MTGGDAPARRPRPVRPFRAVAANPRLRWVALAYLGYTVALYGVFVALLVVAYTTGGAAAAGLVGLSQLVPVAIVAPVAALLIDRYRRDRVLAAGYLVGAGGLAVSAGALAADAPEIVVYGLAALAAVAMTVVRPAQTALLPDLARTPEELTAATVVAGAIESLGLFVGPGIAGVLLGVAGPASVFAGMAGLILGSAFLASRVSTRPTPTPAPGAGAASGVVAELRAGIGATVQEPRLRAVVGALAALAVSRGAMDVLFAVIAFRLLGTGGGGTAFLSTAYGLGAIAGAVATALLIGRRRLAPVVLGGALCWTVALGAVGLAPHGFSAPIFLALAGAGRPLVEVTGRMLLLRGVPARLLGRGFGLQEGLDSAGISAGLLMAPIAVAVFGPQAALVATGVVLPAAVLLGWRRLTAIDATAAVPEAELRLLRAVPIFAPLAAPVLEHLARRLVPVAVPAGGAIIREGEVGDRFYILERGEVGVSVGGRVVDAHGPGGYFGEIALLRGVPRTATVAARTDVRLRALEREDFLAAVTGHTRSLVEAEAVVRARLDERLARERAAAERGEGRT